MLNRKLVVYFSVIFFVLLEIMVMSYYTVEKKFSYEREKNYALRELSEIRGKLEQILNSTFYLVNGMVAYISINPKPTKNEFETYAKALVTSNEFIRNVTLAPNNIISYLYPMKGNEAALGANLAKTPKQQESVYQMMKNKKTVIAGPVNLIQGGKAFINRTPIYVIDENNREFYWGMASVPIKMDAIFAFANLKEKIGILNIALKGHDGLGEKGDVFFGDKKVFYSKPEIMNVNLPNGYWQLAVVPDGGWNRSNPILIVFIGTFLSLALAIGFHIFLNNKISLNELNIKMKNYISIVNAHVIISSTDTKGFITDTSEAFCEISGYKKEELIGKQHSILRHPDMKEKIYVDLWNTITNGKTWNGEIKNRKKNGDYYWVEANISPVFDNNKIVGYTAIRQDITDKKRIEELSIKDEMTKLFNRRYFNEIIDRETKRCKRDNTHFSFLLLDVDHFKQYNDTYGHQAGDHVLIKIGEVLIKYTSRPSDYAFRLGGEEFGIIFTNQDLSQSETYGNKIREAILDLKIEHQGNSANKYVTISAGVVSQKGDEILEEKIIYKFADKCLYDAKRSGRNRVIAL